MNNLECSTQLKTPPQSDHLNPLNIYDHFETKGLLKKNASLKEELNKIVFRRMVKY